MTKIGWVAACFLFSSPLQSDHMLYLHFLATVRVACRYSPSVDSLFSL